MELLQKHMSNDETYLTHSSSANCFCCVLQDLVTEVADLKAQNRVKSPAVRFAPDSATQVQQYSQQPQQQQHPGDSIPAWAQAMIAASPDGRMSGTWPMQPVALAVPTAAELAAAQQLPQLLQKLQRTQEKLEARDASARKYKVTYDQKSERKGQH